MEEKLNDSERAELEDLRRKWNDVSECYNRAYFLTYTKLGGWGSVSYGPDGKFEYRQNGEIKNWENEGGATK